MHRQGLSGQEHCLYFEYWWGTDWETQSALSFTNAGKVRGNMVELRCESA
jgi:hypothetical protein